MTINWRFVFQQCACLVILVIMGRLTTILVEDDDTYKEDAGPKILGQRDARAGVSVALLGEFGPLAADLMWVRAYQEWSARDVEGLRQRLKIVGILDPQTIDFWLNGARMLAYDAAGWRIEQLGMASQLEREKIRNEQLAEAMAHLQEGKRFHRDRYEFGLEAAVLHLRLTGDAESALAALVELEGTQNLPFFVGRIRGELLLKLGRKREALDWWEKFVEELPEGDPSARIDEVRSRIRLLRLELEME